MSACRDSRSARGIPQISLRGDVNILETAQAAGVSEEDVIGAEAEKPVPAAVAREIESLIEQLS
jgi:hypothetical protein